MPGVSIIQFNAEEDIQKITTKTAAVVLETIQGGAGFIVPKNDYLKKVSERCKAVGALLILDEIQPGLGRTGPYFAFQDYGIVPDIFVTGKGLGGGLPIGAFCSSKKLMDLLADNPKLGHITTFGGNPVIAAGALATLKLIQAIPRKEIEAKEALFRKLLVHPKIKQINGKGLMLAPLFATPEIANQVVLKCLDKGLILFWLLWEKRAVRISPPLTISEREIKKGCALLCAVLDEIEDVN